jgi:hypothetical protein
MQSKKLTFLLGAVVLLIGTAVFIGGRLLNQRMDAVGLGAPFEGDFRSMVVPAPELPTASPEVTGAFHTWRDNMITIETKSLEATGPVEPSDTKSQSGPQVEVVVTGQTRIYRETTQPSEPLSVENQIIRQTVAQDTLDAMDSRSMIMVWGRRSGDRVVADVLMYSDMVAIKSAIFKDCEICP